MNGLKRKRRVSTQGERSARALSYGKAPMSTAHDRRSPAPEEPKPQEVPADRARQAVTGHNVRYVLAVSLAAVVIGFVLVFLFIVGRPQ